MAVLQERRKNQLPNIQPQNFQGFGSSVITRAARQAVNAIAIPHKRLEGRRLVRESVPPQPGVYGWLDPHGQLNYVGKSKSLRFRLLSYFDKTPPDPKMQRISENSCSIVWEKTSHELLALIREQELIVRHRPAMNVQGQPHRRQPGYVCMTEGAAPKAYLARKVTARSRNWFGPVSVMLDLNAAILSLNYVFQLRDCPDKTQFRFNNQLQLFDPVDHAKCLRFELNTCPAPCAGACSRGSYMNNVNRAFEFLNGDSSVLGHLENQMNYYSVNKQAYEKAAVLRDQLDSLTWLSRRLRVLRESEEFLNGVYELPGLGRRPVWIWLRRGEIIGCYPKSRRIPKSILDQLALPNGETNLTQDVLHTYLKMLLVSWFRKHPQEKDRMLGVVQIAKAG